MVKILHCADIHFDSPFSGIDAATAESRREEQRELFKKLICYAKNSRIDLMLIPGDLFDRTYTTFKSVEYVCELLATLDCPVVISPGNHDPFCGSGCYSGNFPENVHIFTKEELSYFDFDNIGTDNAGVRVYGYAFTSARYEENPLDSMQLEDNGRINILCAHADIMSPLSKYAPITPRSLADSGFVYAALGHVHNPPEAEKLGSTVVAYSGVLEGRSFDETGFGGAMLVEIDEGGVRCDRVALASRRYMIETIDISGAENDTDALNKIADRIAVCGYRDETALRVVLTGAVSPEYIPSPERLRESIEGLYMLDVKDETLPILDFEALEHDMGARGEFYRTLVRRMKEGSDEERATAAMALRIGLCAIDGKPIIL